MNLFKNIFKIKEEPKENAERISIDKTCCFTGHRNFEHPKEIIKEKTYDLINKAITKAGYTHFIVGGAIGFDMLVAEILLELRDNHYPRITIEIAMPCPNQDKYWNDTQKKKYVNILKRTDKKTLVSETYFKECMQKRNKYMVNNSSVVIAYWTGRPSGTKNTIDYAKNEGKEIWYI